MALRVRVASDDEAARIKLLGQGRTESGGEWNRPASYGWHSRASGSRRLLAWCRSVRRLRRHWLKRFNTHGLAGLKDEPRRGPAPPSTPKQVSALIAAVLTKPRGLGYPSQHGRWTA